MLEIAVMATSLVSSFLIPLIKETGSKLKDKLAEKTSDAAATELAATAATLWDRVQHKERPAHEQAIVSVFASDPDLVREAMERILTQDMEQDEAFRNEVASLLEAKSTEGTTNWQLMGEIVGAVDARGATISGGQVAGVISNGSSSAKPSTAE